MTERSRAPTGLVGAAFLMTLSSAFGQTYFIALFAPWLKRELGLSDGGFGGFFTLGTLASAAILMVAGRLADRWRIRWLAAGALCGLAAMCVAMANVAAAWLLLPILFGLRLCGQGWLSHLAVTGTGRWYVRRRGRMMSLALLGYPVAESVLPIATVVLIEQLGWRPTWLVAALGLFALSLPLVLLLLRNEPAHDQSADQGAAPVAARRDWTRAEVLRRPEFFALLFGGSAPPFVVTGVFFHQVALVEAKGWTIAWFAAWFPAWAGTGVVAALITGWLVDRFDARRLLPLYLLPLAAGVLVLGLATSPYAAGAFMVLAALTSGAGGTLFGTLWAELFGTRHFGAIRSVAFASAVFASALAPGLIGALLDAGVALDHQFIAMAAYTLAAALCFTLVLPRLRRLVRA